MTYYIVDIFNYSTLIKKMLQRFFSRNTDKVIEKKNPNKHTSKRKQMSPTVSFLEELLGLKASSPEVEIFGILAISSARLIKGLNSLRVASLQEKR